MFRRDSKIAWIAPPEGLGAKRSDGFAARPRRAIALPEAAVTFNLYTAVKTLDMPALPGATPEEEIRVLLRAAAEVEHGLMAQYLYAAYSCTAPTIAPEIARIAREEMGHLVSVQNLLLAAGGTPYLGRYDHSKDEFDPFEFHLEPISRRVIAKYAACERPDDKDVDPEELPELPNVLSDAAVASGGVTPHQVGLLYAKIYWLLRETDDPKPDPSEEIWPGYPVEEMARRFAGQHVAAFPLVDVTSCRAKPADWQRGDNRILVTVVNGRNDALTAVKEITSQGEGFGNAEFAHFDTFVTAYVAARTLEQTGPISSPVATDPWYSRPGVPPGRPESEITSAPALMCASLADKLYAILLIAIAMTLHPDTGFDLVRRSLAAEFCLDLMKMGLRKLARELPKVPMRVGSDTPRLALCFTLPVGEESPVEMRAALTELFDNAHDLAARMEVSADLPVTVKSAAQQARTFVEVRKADLLA